MLKDLKEETSRKNGKIKDFKVEMKAKTGMINRQHDQLNR